MSTDLESRVDELESRVRISELVARYCEGVDRRKPEVFASIWHDDAEYLIGSDRGNFKGLEDIRRFSEIVVEVWKETYHWTTNHVVTFRDMDSADGISEAFAMCVKHDGGACFVAARYVDDYSRRDGQWKLAKRSVERWFVSAPQDLDLQPPQ
jgi:ketosteroid isomerase-like protein